MSPFPLHKHFAVSITGILVVPIPVQINSVMLLYLRVLLFFVVVVGVFLTRSWERTRELGFVSDVIQLRGIRSSWVWFKMFGLQCKKMLFDSPIWNSNAFTIGIHSYPPLPLSVRENKAVCIQGGSWFSGDNSRWTGLFGCLPLMEAHVWSAGRWPLQRCSKIIYVQYPPALVFFAEYQVHFLEF